MIRTAMIAAGLAAIACSSAALARPEPVKFVRDGKTYIYTVEQHENRSVLRGTADGASFKLVVSGDNVSGWVGYSPVDFRVSSIRRTKAVEVAGR